MNGDTVLKGGHTLLGNCRRFSYVNADAKQLYAKQLADRFSLVLHSLFNRYQTQVLHHVVWFLMMVE